MARPRGRVRAGNGTRTRDPNLGKVVLYQLSYSRKQLDAETRRRLGVQYLLCAHKCNRPGPPRTRRLDVSASRRLASSGGEGDRTPDLVNAIHALSQLSYAPRILGPAKRVPAGTRHLTGTFWWCQAILRSGMNFSSCSRYHRMIRDLIAM